MRKATLLLLFAAVSGCSTVATHDKYLSGQIDNLDRRLRHVEDRVARMDQGGGSAVNSAKKKVPVVRERRSLATLEPMDLAAPPMDLAAPPMDLAAEPMNFAVAPMRSASWCSPPLSTPTKTSKPSDPFTKNVQKALRKAGYDPGPIDGRMGAMTKRALERFQRAKKLKVTGSTTRATWRLLKRYL
jgi:hypothetical protein